MQRLHIHINVSDLRHSISFYNKLFATEPSAIEADYARWRLEDPSVSFAISTRGDARGVAHLGIEARDSSTLSALRSRFTDDEPALLDEGEVQCCYARSDKFWVSDPTDVPWEIYQTKADVPGPDQCCAENVSSPAADACAR